MDIDLLKDRYYYTNGCIFNKVQLNSRALKDEEAGTLMKVRDRKYRTIRMNKVRYLTHRIIWTMFNGAIPKDYEIDHKDGNTLNNNIDNLRCVTPSINRRNMRRISTNTSGYGGVSWDKRFNKWLVTSYNLEGKQVMLGRYKDKEEAIRVIEEFKKDNGYTNRHGKE